jgi:hypothetical protein
VTADKLLSCLDFVKQTGRGKWIARCSAHDDKSPSLSITEKDDGRVLLCCHAGCSALDVLDSLGLKYSDLFPPDLQRNYRSEHRQRTESVDELVVAIAKSDMRMGKHLNDRDMNRYREALVRLYGQSKGAA